MEHRTLGSSGAVVSTYALGTMTFGNETDEEGSHEQLDVFLEAGGTLVDTADVYTAGASEEIVGRWLDDRPADVTDRVVLATKARFPMGEDPNDVGLSRRHLTRALDASLTRLRVDCIDLYQVHAWDPVTPVEETLGFFDDAVRAGKVRYAGLSNFTGWQVQRTVDVAEPAACRGRSPSSRMYNLLGREIEWEIVPACRRTGSACCPGRRSAAAGSPASTPGTSAPAGATRLGEDPERGVEAYDKRAGAERTWAVVEAVQAVAEGRGASMAAVALAWVHDRPGGVLGDPRRPHHRAADRQPGRCRPAPDPGGDRPAGRGQRPGAGRLPLRPRGVEAALPQRVTCADVDLPRFGRDPLRLVA